MADLAELEPYGERGVILRMGRDARALFLGRELVEDFVAVDVAILRLLSLAVEVPPWDFREEAGHPVDCRRKEFHSGGALFDEKCEARFESFKALATHVLRHHRHLEVVSRSVVTNQCPFCFAVYGDRKAAHRHLLSSLRRGSCRDRSRYLGQVHIPLSLRCPVCSAEPGNWSELQQHVAEHLCDFIRNDGLRDAFLGQAQAGGGFAGAGPSSGETGGGRREKRPRRYSAPCGRAGDSVPVPGQRGRTERADRHRIQDVSGPGSESVSEAMAEVGRIYHESAGAVKTKPEAERADAQEQRGPPYVHVWVAFLCSLAATSWESNVVKSAPVQLEAHVRHCRAKPCKKLEGNEGWTRIVFCLDPVTLFPRERWKQHCRCRKV